MTTTRRLAVVSAGLSQPSSTRLLADRLTAATRDEVALREIEVDVQIIELREHAHDIVNNMLTGFPAESLRRAVNEVTGADGIVVVTPIFNASYSGLFKSFFDVLNESALVDKPVLIAATGGTARHSLALEHALRPLFAYLRAVVMPTSVFAAPEDWASGDNAMTGPLGARVQRAARQLAEQLERAKPAEAADPWALTTTFDKLLAGD